MMNSLIRNILIFLLLNLISLEGYSQSTFSSSRLEKAAINYLQKQFSSEITPLFLIKFSEINFNSSNVKAKFDYIENLTSSIQKLDILFYENNDLIKKIEIPCKVKIHREIVVPNRDIPPNSLIKDDDLITVSRNIEDFNQIITQISQAVGKLANRRFSKGEVIRKKDLLQPQVIKRGQNINIEVISGSVKIYTTGIALQEGAIGDRIRVRRENDNNKSTLEGVVVEDNLIQINLR